MFFSNNKLDFKINSKETSINQQAIKLGYPNILPSFNKFYYLFSLGVCIKYNGSHFDDIKKTKTEDLFIQASNFINNYLYLTFGKVINLYGLDRDKIPKYLWKLIPEKKFKNLKNKKVGDKDIKTYNKYSSGSIPYFTEITYEEINYLLYKNISKGILSKECIHLLEPSMFQKPICEKSDVGEIQPELIKLGLIYFRYVELIEYKREKVRKILKTQNKETSKLQLSVFLSFYDRLILAKNHLNRWYDTEEIAKFIIKHYNKEIFLLVVKYTKLRKRIFTLDTNKHSYSNVGGLLKVINTLEHPMKSKSLRDSLIKRFKSKKYVTEKSIKKIFSMDPNYILNNFSSIIKKNSKKDLIFECAGSIVYFSDIIISSSPSREMVKNYIIKISQLVDYFKFSNNLEMLVEMVKDDFIILLEEERNKLMDWLRKERDKLNLPPVNIPQDFFYFPLSMIKYLKFFDFDQFKIKPIKGIEEKADIKEQISNLCYVLNFNRKDNGILYVNSVPLSPSPIFLSSEKQWNVFCSKAEKVVIESVGDELEIREKGEIKNLPKLRSAYGKNIIIEGLNVFTEVKSEPIYDVLFKTLMKINDCYKNHKNVISVGDLWMAMGKVI